ncbi:MAG: VPLPA-CTERM-specific exosortase XrtD [Pseudomonadota bacterium]
MDVSSSNTLPSAGISSAVRESFRIRAQWAVLLAAFLLLVWISWDGLSELQRQWMNNQAYSHGPMIPLVSAYLLFKLWPSIKAADWTPTPVAPLLLLLALGGWLVGELSALYIIVHYSFLLGVVALYLALTGAGGWRAGWPAFVYLVFMIPLPPFLYNNLSAKLQLISTELGVLGIRAAGVSVFVEGNVIDLGVYQLQVVEACSGLRYLFPLTSFGFLVAVLYHGPVWHRAVILLSTLPITILMNSIRVAIIGVSVEYFGIEVAEGFLHAFEGWFIFLACLLFFAAVIWSLNRLAGASTSVWDRLDFEFPSWHGVQEGAVGRRHRGFFPVVAALMCIISVPVSFAVNDREEQVPERQSLERFPLLMGDWIGREGLLEDSIVDVLGVTDYVVADYRLKADPVPVNFYAAFYESQRTDAKIHSPRSCMPGGGWEIAELSQISLGGALGREAPQVNRVVIRMGSREQLVYYWFQQRGRVITNEYLAKWYLLVDGLTLSRSDGSLIRLVTPILESDVDGRAADVRIQSFIEEIYDRLPAYVPGREK